MSHEGFYPAQPNDAETYLSSLPQTATDKPPKRSQWRTIFIIAIIVLVISLVALGTIGFSYLQGQQKYGKLSDIADVNGDDLASMTVNWDELLAINPDTVAWVRVPGTNIDYPVVRGSDNEYYLSHDFEGDEGWLANFGAIFMDYRNIPNWTDDAYFFYGHHMNDGSMFADIANMEDQERFDDERIVYLLSPYGNFRLRSYSLIHCEADEQLVQISFPDAASMAEYNQEIIDRSIVNVGAIPQASAIKKIFAFSTCDNLTSARYVLYTYVEDTTAEDIYRDKGSATRAAPKNDV